MTQAKPWATCGGCRYFGIPEKSFVGEVGEWADCHTEPRILSREAHMIACRHYVERYTPPPKDEHLPTLPTGRREKTGCPFLMFAWRHSDTPRDGTWIAEGRLPPCEERICRQPHCHNFGEPAEQGHWRASE